MMGILIGGMTKDLTDKGWLLYQSKTTPPRFRARNVHSEAEVGPFPTTEEAMEEARSYETEVAERLAIRGEANGTDDNDQRISVDDELGDNQLFPADLIRADGGTQPREALDMHVVAEYAEAMRGGAVFPAVDVFFDGKDYWLADGFHRLQATQDAGLEEVHANVRAGTQRDALLFSLGANATHGLPRTNADKRRAVTTMLVDDEWQSLSDSEIARRCHVSQPFVGKVREELTTQKVISESTVRRGSDGVTRDVANIGRKSDDEKAADAAANPELFKPPASAPAKPPTARQIDDACRNGFFVFIGADEGGGDRRQVQGASTHYGATPAAKGNVWVSSERVWLEVAAAEVTITDEPFSQGETGEPADQVSEIEAELRDDACPPVVVDRSTVRKGVSSAAEITGDKSSSDFYAELKGWSKATLSINISIKPGKSAKARRFTITGRIGDGPPISREFASDDLGYELEYGLGTRICEMVDGLKDSMSLPPDAAPVKKVGKRKAKGKSKAPGSQKSATKKPRAVAKKRSQEKTVKRSSKKTTKKAARKK
jgi:hypothetical protein